MSHLLPPWCLTWGRDGELSPGDRQDVLQSLVLEDNRLACLLLSQAISLNDRQSERPADRSAMPQHTFFPF